MPRIKLSYHTSYPTVVHLHPANRMRKLTIFNTLVNTIVAPIKLCWMRLL